MKKKFFRFITYVVVFLCLYNNAVPSADSLQPSSIFDGESSDEEVLLDIRREYERRAGISEGGGKVQISVLYLMANREIREGILEKGVLIYEYILKLFPEEKDARMELASIWFRLGHFKKALSYIDEIQYREGDADYDKEKSIRLERLKKDILSALEILDKKRELERKGYRAVVVPDGKGGYFLDTIGFRSKWIFADRAGSGVISPCYVLRLIKSLAFVIEQRSQLLGNVDNMVNEVILISGTDKKVVFQKKRDADGYRVFVSKIILNDLPQEQRALFSELFKKSENHIEDTGAEPNDINIPRLSKDKKIISIALNKSLEEGRNLLSDLLTKEGFSIERENMGNDEDWGLMRLNSWDSEFSDIMERYRERAVPLAERIASNNFQAVCISIDNQSVEKAYILIEEIRKRKPDIFIIIGGPLSSLPEQMISLLPGADAVIAGEADISLPRLFNLLSRDGREISPPDLVSATNGGFYLRSGNNIFIDNLYKTDKPEDIHMAVPYDDKRSETIFTSRGCPYNCTFCNLILGKKFRAVPVDEVIDWLIHKLALKMSAERKEEITYDAVKKLLESSENLYSHELRFPIMIKIWDDNFFINRNRVIALFHRIIELGLNRYFTFAVEGASLRAIQRNGGIDREMMDLALRAGVTILKFGIDGFSQRNLVDFNKGYSQEDIVKAIFELHDIGFLVGTNAIDSSPRTFYSDMLEGIILFGILPAYYEVYDNPGVAGDLTNELTVYESLSHAGEMRWEKVHKIFSYYDEGSYMVPEAEEYAYRRYNLLRIYDKDTQQAARRMFSKDFNLMQHLTSEECKKAFPLVLKRWVSGECGPELKALGEIFIKLLDRYNGDIYKARARVREDIRRLYCTGFINLKKLYERYGYGEDLDIKTVYRIDELDTLLNNAVRTREFGKAVRLADIASKISGGSLKYLYLGAAIDYIRYFYGDLGITLGDIIKNSGINIPLFYKDHMDRLNQEFIDYLIRRINGMHPGFPDEASGMTFPEVWEGFTENMSIIADNIIEALRFINGEIQAPVYKPLKVKEVNKKQALEEYAKVSFEDLMQEPLEEEAAASDFTRMLSYESSMRRLAGLDDIGDQLGELYGRTEKRGKLADILLDSLIRDMEFRHDNFRPFNERRVYKNHFNYCTVLQPEPEDILIGTLGYDYYDEDKDDFVIFFKGEKEEETEDGGKERKVYIGMMSLDEYLNFSTNHLKGFIPGTLKAGLVYSNEGSDEILRVKEYLGYEDIDFVDIRIDSPWLNIAVTDDGFCIVDRRDDSVVVNRAWHELEMDLFIKEKVVVSQEGSSTDVITVWDGKSDLAELLKDADIVMLGAPDSTGTKRNLGFGGAEKAPDSVIDELLKRDLSRLKGLKVVYLGNIKIPETDRMTRVKRKDGQEVTFPDALLETYGDIKSVVSAILRINPDIKLVQIGGDHGNAYPFNAPFGRLGFINVDAHFDTRDPRDPTRPEGPNSGTPFRFLLEEGHTPPENAAFLGIDKDNPYAPKLEEWVRSVGVENIVPYQEVMRRWKEDRANFAQFIDELLEKVVLGVDTGHISFCIDVVNENEAPGCSARNKNGLTSEVVRFIAGRAGVNKKFRSIGVFEIIPELDTDNKTIRLGADIIVEYFNGSLAEKIGKNELMEVPISKAISELDAFLNQTVDIPEPEFVGFGWGEARPSREFLQEHIGEILGLVTDGRIAAHRLLDGRIRFTKLVEHLSVRKGAKIRIYRGKELIKECDTLGKEEFSGLSGVTIKTRLDKNGHLTIGGKPRGAFINYPDTPVEIDMVKGVIVEVRILTHRGIVRDEYILMYRDDGLYDSRHSDIRKVEFGKWDGIVLRKRMDSNGLLTIGGRHMVIEKYPYHPVEIHIRNGVITEVRILEKTERLIDAKNEVERVEFSLIYDKKGSLVDSYYGALIMARLAKLDGVTIKRRLDNEGRLSLGDKVWATLIGHAGNPVEADIDNGVVTEIRVYGKAEGLLDTDEAAERIEMALIYRDGRLIDSNYGGLGERRFSNLDGVTIRTRLNQFGNLVVGGGLKAAFIKYGGYPIEIDVREGIITEVRIFKESDDLRGSNELVQDGRREFSLVFDKGGRLVKSYNEQMSEVDFKKLHEHTIITRLDTQGVLSIGGRERGQHSFSSHPNGVVAIRVRNGFIIEVDLLKCRDITDINDLGQIKPNLVQNGKMDFSFIYDREGVLEETYSTQLRWDKMKDLDGHTVITRLNSAGVLTIGGQSRAGFLEHPNGVVMVKIQKGIITEVALLSVGKTHDVDVLNLYLGIIKGRFPFKLVWDRKDNLVDSFYSPWWIPIRFRRHLGKITGNFEVDRYNGFLHRGKSYYFGDDVDLRGYPIRELIFNDRKSPGEITQFVIYNQKSGEIVRIDARKVIQEVEPEDLMIETIYPSKHDTGKPVRIVGIRARNPEEAVLRTEEIALVREILAKYTEEERGLILDVALLYYDRRSHDLPYGIHGFWFLKEFIYEWELVDEIARELGVTRGWLLERFHEIREVIKTYRGRQQAEVEWTSKTRSGPSFDLEVPLDEALRELDVFLNETGEIPHPEFVGFGLETNYPSRDYIIKYLLNIIMLEAIESPIYQRIVVHRMQDGRLRFTKLVEHLRIQGVLPGQLRQSERDLKRILDFVENYRKEPDQAGKCVTGDTILPIIRGEVQGILIVDVRPGDYVLSLNEETQRIEPHRIKGLLDMGIKPVYKLTTESGRTIKTTVNHPYLTKDGWVKAGELNTWGEIGVPNGNGAAYERDTGQSPRQLIRMPHRLTGLIAWLISFYQSSSFLSLGQLMNPKINDIKAKQEMPSFVAKLKSRKNPLAQPAIAVNLNISKNVFEIMSRRFLWNIGILLNKVYYAIGFVSRYFLAEAGAAEIRGDIVWDRIASIEYIGYDHVYDIEVEGTHNFIGNGIFAHNTYIDIGGQPAFPSGRQKNHRFRKDIRELSANKRALNEKTLELLNLQNTIIELDYPVGMAGFLYFDVDKLLSESKETAQAYVRALVSLLKTAEQTKNFAVVLVNSHCDWTFQDVIGVLKTRHLEGIDYLIENALIVDASETGKNIGSILIERAYNKARRRLGKVPQNIILAIYRNNLDLYPVDLLKRYILLILSPQKPGLDEDDIKRLSPYLPGLRYDKETPLLPEVFCTSKEYQTALEAERKIRSQA